MLQNYILVAWRTLNKNKLFSIINVFGLSLALALGMVIVVHVINILRFDSFHKHGDRIYRIISEIKSSEGGEWTLASSPLPLRDVLAEDESLFENAVRIYPAINEEASAANKVLPVRGAFTSSAFFKTFSFELQEGDSKTALDNPNDIVISATTAKKFFEDREAVGKMIVFEKLGAFKVTGVLKDAPFGSHINFDVLVSESGIANLENQGQLPLRLASWNSFEFAYTYVLLNDAALKSNLDDKLLMTSNDLNKGSQSGSFNFKSQALSSITPSWDDIYNDIGSGTTWGKMLAEVGVGLIIILAACFNYTNLSIARAFSRTKEIGLRKVVGARRRQVFMQYLVEAVMVSFLSLFFAQVILVILIELQLFEGTKLSDFDLTTIGYVIVFTAFVGLLAGMVPAWILSSLQPLKMLRNVMSEKIMIGLTPRKALIVFQFAISLLVLIFMTTFHSQFSFMAEVDPGFRMQDIISIPIDDKSYNAMAGEISRESDVVNIAALSGDFGRYPTGAIEVSKQGEKGKSVKINYFFVDGNVLDVSRLSLSAGANFTEQPPAYEHQVILNEKAVEILGYHSPSEAVGETVLLADSVPVTVTGVIKNFYSEGVGIPYRPLALRHKAGKYRKLQVVITPGNEMKMQTRLEQIWKRVCPDSPFTFVWLKDQHDERYADMGSISILGFLAFMAISIALLGLLGLVVYTVETKKKEISIRKVIGANSRQIMYLLSKGFMMLLLISGLIAVPLSYLASEMFLMNFANRISVGILTPVLCFGGLVTVCLLMILSQTFTAAAQNPARNLKSE